MDPQPISATCRVVRSAFTTSSLICGDQVVDRVRALCEPYFVVEGSTVPNGWVVVDGADPPARAIDLSVNALGETPIRYGVDHDEQRLFHIAPPGNEWAAQSLLRATRAIHRSAAQRAGMLFLHSGLVRVGGRGIALVGGSRAGKTSLIMSIALSNGGQIVSNDDVGIIEGDDAGHHVEGFGWPRSISIRLDTLDLLFGPEEKAQILGTLTHPANQTILSLRDSGIERHGTALIYPYECTALVDARLLARCRVDAVVHVSLADRESDRTLERVSPKTATKLLGKRVQSVPNKHLNIFDHTSDIGRHARVLDRLASLPAYRFCYQFKRVRDEADLLLSTLTKDG